MFVSLLVMLFCFLLKLVILFIVCYYVKDVLINNLIFIFYNDGINLIVI